VPDERPLAARVVMVVADEGAVVMRVRARVAEEEAHGVRRVEDVAPEHGRDVRTATVAGRVGRAAATDIRALTWSTPLMKGEAEGQDQRGRG
jgi:hypothetical protein